MKTLAFAFMITVSAIPLAWGQALHPVDKAEVECLRVVSDPDGTANVRSGPSLDAKVTGKVKSGTVVSIFEAEGDWTMLQSQGNYPGQNEYMHTSRLKTLDDWKEARPKKTTFKRGTVEDGGVQVEVVAEPWEKAKHKVTRDPDRGMLVDGHGVQGTDGNLPSHAIAGNLGWSRAPNILTPPPACPPPSPAVPGGCHQLVPVALPPPPPHLRLTGGGGTSRLSNVRSAAGS